MITRIFVALLFATIVHAADTAETLQVGGRFALLATSDGNPTPSFDWFKNGVKVATGPTFTIEAVTMADAGAYHVVASNEVGSASSSKYLLAIDDRTAPVIVMAPLDARIREGESLTLSVVATGNPAPTFQWRKNGTDIPGATTQRLTLSPITRSDAGTYVVVVTNEKGVVMSGTAVVDVLFAPSAPIITRPLSNLVVPKKTTVTLRVEASGEELAFQWKKGSSLLPGKTSPALMLASVNPADAGVYSVSVENPQGRVTSSARLTVLK